MSSDIEFVLDSTVRGFHVQSHVYRADYLRAVWDPFGRLSGPRPSESHLGPWPRWRNLSGRQWSLDWRLILFLLDLRLHNVVLDTNHGWTCAHVYVRVRICTCRIIRDPINSRSWNFDHNNLIISRSLKKNFFFGITNYSTNTVSMYMKKRSSVEVNYINSCSVRVIQFCMCMYRIWSIRLHSRTVAALQALNDPTARRKVCQYFAIDCSHTHEGTKRNTPLLHTLYL